MNGQHKSIAAPWTSAHAADRASTNAIASVDDLGGACSAPPSIVDDRAVRRRERARRGGWLSAGVAGSLWGAGGSDPSRAGRPSGRHRSCRFDLGSRAGGERASQARPCGALFSQAVIVLAAATAVVLLVNYTRRGTVQPGKDRRQRHRHGLHGRVPWPGRRAVHRARQTMPGRAGGRAARVDSEPDAGPSSCC